jgi:hypothetical protein
MTSSWISKGRKMDVPWSLAKGHFKNLDSPNLGDSGDWDVWYEQAWQHVGVAGLTNVEKPLDLTLVNLRIAALCWLVHDFCASVDGNEWATVPYWSDWIKELEIDPAVAALLLRSSGQSSHLLSDSSLTDPELLSDDEEGIWLWEVGGMSKRLWPQVIMNAVFQERGRITDALLAGFDGLIPLFESMITCTGECNVSLTSPERMRGYQWIENCCEVLITGEPEVNLPDTNTEGSNDSF